MNKSLVVANRILLGLLMLVPGLTKLFVVGADGISGMLGGIFLFSWAPVFWAWVLILSEIVFGIAIIANWKVEKTAWPPILIMVIAVLFMTIKWTEMAKTQWSSVIFHLIAITGYLMISKKFK